MSANASKTLIGAFVVGAVSLLIIALIVVSSGSLFSRPSRVVMFFNTSIRGLSVGSAVLFRGVQVGRVASIAFTGDVKTLEVLIPVFVDIDKTSESIFFGDSALKPKQEASIDALLANGLRARLSNQSLLTGQLLIELDFHPQNQLTGTNWPSKTYQGFPVMPTIPSQLDTVWRHLSQLPIDDLVESLLGVSNKLNAFLSSEGVQQLPESLHSTLTEARKSMQGIDLTMEALRDLAQNANTGSREVFARLSTTLEQYTKLSRQLEEVVQSIGAVVSPDSAAMAELNRAIRTISESARAVRALATTLERNPEALLRGRGADKR